jgi:hypothetical protein
MASAGATVACRVIGEPKGAGLALETRVVVEATGNTVRVTGGDCADNTFEEPL